MVLMSTHGIGTGPPERPGLERFIALAKLNGHLKIIIFECSANGASKVSLMKARDPLSAQAHIRNSVAQQRGEVSFLLLAGGQAWHSWYSHQWAAEALTSVGSRGTHIGGQPRHSH